MTTLIREFSVLIICAALLVLTIGLIGRGGMIVAPETTTGQIVSAAVTAALMVLAGLLLSGGLRGPSFPYRLLASALITAAAFGIAAGGYWIWDNMEAPRLQVAMGILGTVGLGIVAVYFGSSIGGLARSAHLELAKVVLLAIVAGLIISAILSWAVIEYPKDDWCYAWALGSAIFLFALLDAIWINAVMLPLYKAAMNGAILPKLRTDWGVSAWAVVVGGLAAFIIVPHGVHQDWWRAAAWGAGYGLATSGFYALTLLTGFKGYNWKLGALDTGWGMFLTAAITLYVSAAASVGPVDVGL